MSELKDLKVGDLISILATDSPNWICMRIPDESALNEANEAIASGFTVQHGLHPSLIPEGYAIVPVEPTRSMIEAAYAQSEADGLIVPQFQYEAMIKASQSIIKK